MPPVPALPWPAVAVPPRPPPDLAAGKAAFERSCSPCHGSAGDGHGTLARFLRVPPANLTRGDFKLKSVPADAAPLDADLFRTVTAGIPPSNMPSFAHLPAAERWALVDYVKSLSAAFAGPAAAPLELGDAPPVTEEEGARAYRAAGCAACHGEAGRGDGPSAAELSTRPPDLTLGPGAFKGGARPRDVLRTLLTGLAGSPMPSYAASGLSRRDLWAVSSYVAGLAARGRPAWVARWRSFLGTLGFDAPAPAPPRADVAPAFPAEDGCLRCHRGVEDINDKMQPVLVAMAGGRRGAACAVCHGGDPDGASERAAHRGMLPNPGSLWAVGLGQGCGACHAAAGSLATFQGHPLPLPVGGRLMSVVSTVDDPTGATGSGHAYRVPRALMAAELGKATTTLAANGLIPKGGPAYADVPIDDPDGPVPAVGSPAYRAWVERAMAQGFLRHVDHASVIPDVQHGRAMFGTLARAAVGDMFRKDCARCHLWDRGVPGAGGRHRSEGCSACHVVYGLDGLGHGGDPTMAGEGPGHPLEHRITARIPSSQCAHCHWRGGGYYTDLHYRRGLECQDCHDSVDVHGDGNVYPTMHLQVSIACEDCHGTSEAYPWELPVGHGTPVTLPGARGTFHDADGDHLISERGNVEARWLRRGDQAVLQGLDGHEHPIPLLKDRHLHGWGSEEARVAMDAIPAHLSKLECNACHVKRIVQCQGCHVDSDFRRDAVDWVASASARAGPFGQPGPRREEAGFEHFAPSNRALVEPALGVDLQGKVTGLVPGCLLTMRVVDPDGGVSFLRLQHTSEGLPSDTLAPLIPHAVTRGARSCESCHASPQALGYGVAQGRDVVAEPPPVPERRHELMGRIPEFPMAHGMEAAPAGGAEPTDHFDVNRLVTRSGERLKSLADPGERPLSDEERDATEREGVCLACHRMSGTAQWEALVKKIGKAPTPAAHDRAVEEILKGYLRK